MNGMLLLNLLTVVTLLGGLFFMFVGAVGVWRLPDVYHRMIAATKCVTLGISGMLLASVLHFATLGLAADKPAEVAAVPGDAAAQGSSPAGTATKALLVIVFQFVAAPVGAYMLARAAHLDGARLWKGTLSDDLADDDRQHNNRTAADSGSSDGVSE